MTSPPFSTGWAGCGTPRIFIPRVPPTGCRPPIAPFGRCRYDPRPGTMPATPGRPPVAPPVALANGSGSFALEVRAVYGVVGGVVIVGGSLLLTLLAIVLVR